MSSSTPPNMPPGAGQAFTPNDEPERATLSELRGSVGEVLRIISVRRWMFIVPFCIVTTGAFVLSLYVPRRFEASTMFERRDDPVLMNLPRTNGTGAFEIFRRTIVQDVANISMIRDAVHRLRLAERPTEAQPVPPTTAEAIAQREQALAARISSGLRLSFRHSSEHLDVIEIKYSTPDVNTMLEVLNEVRDSYIRSVQKRISQHLRSTKEWFDQEAEKRQAVVDALEEQFRRFKDEHRGLDPLNPEGAFVELANAKADLIELGRKARDLRIRIEGRKSLLELGPPVPSQGGNERTSQPVWRSPETIRLMAELKRIESEIGDLKTARNMTERHPDVVALREQSDRIASELEQQQTDDAKLIAEMSPNEAMPPTVDSPWMAAKSQTESDLVVLRQLLADNAAEMKEVSENVAELEQIREAAKSQRKEFSVRQAEMKGALADLSLYSRYSDQVARLLAAEKSQKGILFEKIRPASGSRIPVSPRVSTVLLLTLVAGMVSGVVMILLSELFDRTIRTRSQVSRVLGLPILESIDEIVGSASRRKRLLARAVFVPAITTALFTVVALSGTVAYLSLQHKPLYERVMQVPLSTLRSLVGGSFWSRTATTAALSQSAASLQEDRN